MSSEGILSSSDLCQCGHYIYDHRIGFSSVIGFFLIQYFRHNCEYCMCAEYNYEVTHNKNFDGTETFTRHDEKYKDIYKANGVNGKMQAAWIALVTLAVFVGSAMIYSIIS